MTRLTLSLMLFAMTVTPGPNNIVLLHRASSHGFYAGLPLALGIAVGGCVMLLLSWGLLDQLHQLLPNILSTLSIISFMVLLGMSIMLWIHDQNDNKSSTKADAFGFWSMATFQCVNPKTWAFLGSLITFQSASANAVGIIPLALTFVTVSMICSFIWLAAGDGLEHWLRDPCRKRRFNRCMSIVLMLTALSSFLQIRGGSGS